VVATDPEGGETVEQNQATRIMAQGYA
jgi:hypothetical protein